MVAQWITTAGLACDILGAWLVAIEVVRAFRRPGIIDIGHAGTLDGRKRYLMSRGLFFLTVGFLLQGLGTWWPSLTAP